MKAQHHIALVVVSILAGLTAIAAEYHVAVSGDDANPGTADKPLRTIQAAAQKALPGDTVTVHAGTYRETVAPARSGEADKPIIFQAAKGEAVLIDGSDPVTGWKPWKDGIEQATMAGDWFSRATPGDGTNLYDAKVRNQADQLFVDGQMMLDARWPNAKTLDPSFPTKAVTEKFISKNRDQSSNWTTGTLEDAEFNLPASAAVGAEVMLQPNWDAWSWLLTGRIIAVNSNQWTYQSRSDSGKDFKQNTLADKSRYFLFNKLELLDAPGEWFHDKAAGVLYLKSPDGQPLEGRVSAKKREYAFDLTGKSYITLRGFKIHACTITTDRDSGGDNIGYDATGKARYPWRNAARGLANEPFHQINAYQDAPSTGVVLENLDARYLSHFTDVSGHFFGQWGQSSGIVLSGRNHRINGCRIRYSAGNGITAIGREHRILGNLIEDTGYAANDCCAIHTGVTGRGSSDHEIAWNTIRRTGRSALLPRTLYRSDPSDGSDWKARIHHNDISGFGIQDWDQGGIYNAAGDARYLRVDHNWIHDTHENVDDLPGARAFTASGIYPDYCARWLIDHNVIWNVEWGIHLQNELEKGKLGPAGYVVLNNTIAVRTIGGGPSRHGPYGVVKNSAADLKDTLIADNVILLTDQSASFKPIDFEGDAKFNRVVDNNVSGRSAPELGLTGGSEFPAALVPTKDAGKITGKAQARALTPVNGLAVPAISASRDVGALPAGLPAWRAGHEAWKGNHSSPSSATNAALSNPGEPTRVVFVRHVQTLANATGDYSANRQSLLTDLGKQQAQELVQKLEPFEFDRIAVSPAERALRTILPYLEATHQKAEIWPTLHECCNQKGEARQLAATGQLLPAGEIQLPQDCAAQFVFPTDSSRYWLKVDTYQDGLEQIRLAKAQIDDYATTAGRTLLVVGHSLMGGRLVELMTKGEIEEKIYLENAKVTILRRNADGTYTLERLNDKPCSNATKASRQNSPRWIFTPIHRKTKNTIAPKPNLMPECISGFC
jgi:broad specificity phosphatase PhoE